MYVSLWNFGNAIRIFLFVNQCHTNFTLEGNSKTFLSLRLRVLPIDAKQHLRVSVSDFYRLRLRFPPFTATHSTHLVK